MTTKMCQKERERERERSEKRYRWAERDAPKETASSALAIPPSAISIAECMDGNESLRPAAVPAGAFWMCEKSTVSTSALERPEPGAAARHPAAARCLGGGAASGEFEGVVGYLTTRPAGPIDALVGIGTKPMESTSEAGIPRSLSFCANERNESL